MSADTEYNELLLVLSLPDMRGVDGELLDADRMANGLVQIINEEWARNAEGRPDWFRPARIYLNPPPQWLDATGAARLIAAARAVSADPVPEETPRCAPRGRAGRLHEAAS